MTNLSQRDPRWKSLKLGTSNGTIGEFGCTITALSMVLGTTPDVVNERLLSVNGYAQGNLVIWAKIEEAFPGIKIKRVWTYDNADVLKNVPNVLVEVDGKPIGGFRHWVVYIGNKKAIDPWDGTEKPTSSYPSPLSYCVIGGQWKKPSPVQDTVAVDKATFETLVRKSTCYDQVRAKLNVADSETIILTEIDKLLSYEDSVIGKDKQLQDAKSNIDALSQKTSELLEANITLGEDNKKLSTKVKEQERTIVEQGFNITMLGKDIEDLKASAKLPLFSGWKKKIVDLLAKF